MKRLQILLGVLGALGVALWVIILLANRMGVRRFRHPAPQAAAKITKGAPKIAKGPAKNDAPSGQVRVKPSQPFPTPPKKVGPAGPANLQAAVTPFYQSVPFPTGVESRARIMWGNSGKGTALEARADAKIYFRPRSDAGEKAVVRDWKSSFETFLKYHRYANREAIDLFPTNKASPPLESIALGPPLTLDDIKKITDAKETIFVVGAIRFQDSLGEHEAHTCEYVSLYLGSTITAGSPYKMRFVKCKDYNSQVDIPN